MKNKIILGLISIFAIIFIAFFFTEDVYNSFLMNALYTFPALAATICSFYVFKKLHYSSARGKVFLFLTLGMSFWFLAEFLWMMMVVFFNAEPFPSFVDVFYLIAYPLVFVGFWLEYRMGEIKWTTKKVAVISFISIFLVALTGYFGVYYAYDAGNSFWENAFNIMYGIGDVILSIITLYILMIVIEYKQGKFFRPWAYIFIANILMIIGDMLFSIYFEEYNLGIRMYQYMEFFWVCSYLMFAYGFFGIGYVIEGIHKDVLKKNEIK